MCRTSTLADVGVECQHDASRYYGRAVIKFLLPALVLFAACHHTPMRIPEPSSAGAPAATPTTSPVKGTVQPGIEVFLADLPQAVRGKRIGLITNHSAIDRSRASDIDLIAQHK